MCSDNLVPTGGAWIVNVFGDGKRVFDVTIRDVETEELGEKGVCLGEAFGEYLGVNLGEFFNGVATL